MTGKIGNGTRKVPSRTGGPIKRGAALITGLKSKTRTAVETAKRAAVCFIGAQWYRIAEQTPISTTQEEDLVRFALPGTFSPAELTRDPRRDYSDYK